MIIFLLELEVNIFVYQRSTIIPKKKNLLIQDKKNQLQIRQGHPGKGAMIQ